MFERAKACVAQMKNSDVSKRLTDFIEKHYKVIFKISLLIILKAYLKRENKAEELLQ